MMKQRWNHDLKNHDYCNFMHSAECDYLTQRATFKPTNALPSVINSTHHKKATLFICKMICTIANYGPHICCHCPHNPYVEQATGSKTVREDVGNDRFTEWCSGAQELWGFTAGLLPLKQRHLQSRPGSFLLRLIMLVFTRPRSPFRTPPPRCQTTRTTQQRGWWGRGKEQRTSVCEKTQLVWVICHRSSLWRF